MEPEHRAVLRKFRVQLSDQLLISDTIVPFLYQEGVLTEAQVEQVEGQLTNRQKNLKLLDLLPNRGPRAFCAFLEALRDFGWIRDRLLLELQNSAGTGPPGPNLAENGLSGGAAVTARYHGDGSRIPDSVLQRVPSDRELSRLAQRLGAEWEPVLLDLGLSAEAVYRCRSDHSLNTGAAVLNGLVLWRRAGGRRATVGRLLRSLEAADLHPSVLEEAVLA
ncbi:death domain-containing protein CRADD [Poecilia latipinna]|uniref:CASP2 and RIPK1 domain containing adaptor with death domain n=2 Tax=Poecilia TaxID=8080 RepID=A0A087Y8C6_POEFO|nr:PREDICTED: death domain-containing protein CRADD [Poecilia formosa]XP_014878559.1 PREDICTED: death domain-containing protein CRADD-like [Poecilia latipinna]